MMILKRTPRAGYASWNRDNRKPSPSSNILHGAGGSHCRTRLLGSFTHKYGPRTG